MRYLLLILLACPAISFSQSRLTDEDVFIYYLKRTTDYNNPQISDDQYNLYCQTFDPSNYNKTKNNEFERRDYYTKMMAKIKMKVKNFNYTQTFSSPPSYTDLKEYDFNNESFELKNGPGLKKYNVGYLSLDANWYNFKTDFPYLSLKMNPTEAKDFLAAKKDIKGYTNRRVYLVLKFNFMDMDFLNVNKFPIYCRQIDIYNDQNLTQKLGIISAATNSINSITGISTSQNNKSITEFYNSSWNTLTTRENITFEEAKSIAADQKLVFRIVEYKSNKLINPVKYYYYDGLVYATENFSNNNCIPENKNGISTVYFRNGQKTIELNYLNGKKVKYEAGWFENGKLKYVHTFFPEERGSGPNVEYNETGERILQDYYYYGNLSESESGNYYKPERFDLYFSQNGFPLPDQGRGIYRPIKSIASNKNSAKEQTENVIIATNPKEIEYTSFQGYLNMETENYHIKLITVNVTTELQQSWSSYISKKIIEILPTIKRVSQPQCDVIDTLNFIPSIELSTRNYSTTNSIAYFADCSINLRLTSSKTGKTIYENNYKKTNYSLLAKGFPSITDAATDILNRELNQTLHQFFIGNFPIVAIVTEVTESNRNKNEAKFVKINVGRNQGIFTGYEFIILDLNKDSKTGDLEVTGVYEGYSICKVIDNKIKILELLNAGQKLRVKTKYKP